MQEQNKNIRRYADYLDTKFKIPGTNLTFGIDFIVGLIPGFGDALGLILSSGLVMTMVAKGASGRALALMILNVILDTTIGAIPVIGDIFDFFFKANKRNLDLFQDHFEAGEHEGSAWSVVIPVLIVLLSLVVLAIWGIIKLLNWVIS